ncbi:MAG: hypothetical protein ABI740_06405 [Alphaproteobacteria bacterium]
MNKLVLVAVAWTMAASGACGAPPEKKVAAVDKSEQGRSVQAKSQRDRSSALAPAQAIAAASKADDGAEGVFEFQVGSVGETSRKGRPVFLNSEADYHNPKNLSVMIQPAVVKEVEAAAGGSLDKTLANKRIKVTGVAKQVKVAVYGEDHEKTGTTVTQTRITVTNASQIAMK